MKLRRFLPEILASGFIALVVLGLWAGPHLLNWERYRGTLAALASDRLGRPVTLDGAITLTLLPQPRVEAAQVVIGPGSDGVSVTARALRLRLALAPLLRGRFEPREIALVGGEISLPWPPAQLGSVAPPPWLNELDARLQDSRLLLGGLRLEGLNGRLTAGDAHEALVAEGSLAWRGQAVRFNARLGRAGADGVAPLELGLAVLNATLQARGVLLPGGSFEGRLETAGQDLSLLLPAPPGPFRASGRLNAIADLLEAGDLALELGGQPARGSVTLRLAPEPRVDVALAATRLDLDAWVAALRTPRGSRLPVGVELAVESTRFAGLPLRRLRGAFFAGAERLTLSDVSAVLPGEAELEIAGASAAQRLELAVRFKAPAVRETLLALGLPLAGADPVRLRGAEGRFRLVLDAGEVTLSEVEASLDGARLSGNAVWRPAREAARASLGLGLTLDRLDLDALLPAEPHWAQMAAQGPGYDLNLRLAAEELVWRGVVAQRAALDATLENTRLALRRLTLRLGELDVAAGGALVLGAQPRFADLLLEVAGPNATGLGPLLPAGWALPAPLLAQPLALRLGGGGAAEAVALRAEADLGEVRLEASGTLNAAQQQGQGTLTLRHPNAVRLLAGLGAPAEWLGQGSLAVVAALAAGPRQVAAEQLDLVAGGLRTRGTLALALGGARPRLSGRLAADALPLPGLDDLAADRLPAWDLDLALEAARVESAAGPVLEQAAARLMLEDRKLRLVGLQGRLAGGQMQAGLLLDASQEPPRLELQARLAEVVLAPPLLDLPLDLQAGRLDASARLTAAGHGLPALLATLAGPVDITVRDGVLTGLDLGAVAQAAGLAETRAAEAGLRQAMLGGATAFERLDLAATLEAGRARLGKVALVAEAFGTAGATGEVDLPRGMLDLRLTARPVAEAPEVRLRLTGPLAAPRRLPELADFLRYRAAQ